MLPARLFMGDVEETSLGPDIDCASLRLGLRMLRRHPDVRLSINVSVRSIGDGAWRRVLDAEFRPGVGERLILEVSEGSAMLLPEVVIRFMAEMRPKGVSFAMDDFGAGLIAFRHLKDFFFVLVKVDRCFVAGIDANPDNQVIAEALVTVAHQFEMFAVAEGVETEARPRSCARSASIASRATFSAAPSRRSNASRETPLRVWGPSRCPAHGAGRSGLTGVPRTPVRAALTSRFLPVLISGAR